MSEGERCITCADEGVVVRVAEPGAESAVCVTGEGSERVEVAVELVGPVAAGDLLVVHAGVAIGRVAA